jgi:peroxiredoxin Q/BCP
MGIERSTFIINPEGKIVQEWRNVKVPEHVNKVAEWLKANASS